MYNFWRYVDYCSAACLVVRSSVFNLCGGFSYEYTRAYYEDTDLCMAIWKNGYKVVYNPLLKVVHHGGMTAKSSMESKGELLKTQNLAVFHKKWSEELASHCLKPLVENQLQGAMRRRGQPSILIIDTEVPMPDVDSGSVRINAIMENLLALGCSVTFLPSWFYGEPRYTELLRSKGIDVIMPLRKYDTPLSSARQIIDQFDYVWICKVEPANDYMADLKSVGRAKFIYDTVDLHYVRLKREGEIEGSLTGWEEIKQLELSIAKHSEATLVVTETEKQILSDEGIQNIHVMPNQHAMHEGNIPGFAERSGLVFIGGYKHRPNVDAAKWFISEIMPLVWKELGQVSVTLLGSNPSEEVKDLAGDLVKVPGYLNDVDSYFLESRVFVCPLRYGAGMKGKLGQALSFSLPTVTTSIGAEGMDLRHDQHVLIADEAQSFAAEIVRLYRDEELWNRISGNSTEALRPWSADALKDCLKGLLKDLDIESKSGTYAI